MPREMLGGDMVKGDHASALWDDVAEKTGMTTAQISQA